jgi:hypothetical protein
MTIEIVTEFIGGGTVEVMAYIKDTDDALVDPTSVSITITDSARTVQVNGSPMVKSATGTYGYSYNTSSTSAKRTWKILVTVVDGTGASSKTSYGTASFKVT